VEIRFHFDVTNKFPFLNKKGLYVKVGWEFLLMLVHEVGVET
jgi:hypothetical protein